MTRDEIISDLKSHSSKNKVGNVVLINNHPFVVRSIQPNRIYISPENNPDQLSLLYKENNEWQVYGTEEEYNIQFERFSFTGVPDVDIFILSHLSDSELSMACRTNSYLNRLCESNELWSLKITNEYGVSILRERPKALNMKEYYQYLKTASPNLAARDGLVSLLDYFKSEKGELPNKIGSQWAAAKGELQSLEWLLHNQIEIDAITQLSTINWKCCTI
jgi:hypothetical protein